MSGFDFAARALAQKGAELFNQVVRPERHAGGSRITGKHLAAAIEEAHANFDLGRPAIVALPPREIVVEAPLPAITRPIAIIGMSRRLSSLRFTGNGQMFTFRNCGFGQEEEDDFPILGDRPHTGMETIRSGLVLRDFAVTGDRTLAQDAFVFEGNCDNVLMADVAALYFRGHALHLGKPHEDVHGNVRESLFSRFMFRRCGDRVGSKATIYIHNDPVSASGPLADSSMLTFRDGFVVYPQGHGIHIHAPDGTTAGSAPISDVHFDDVRLQSQAGTSDPELMSNGDLVRIEGDVHGVTGNIAPARQQGPHGYAFWLGADGNKKPVVDLTVRVQEADQAVYVGAVRQAKLVLPRPYARKVLVEGQAFSSGKLVLIVDNDVNYLTAAAVTLNGTDPVAVDFINNSVERVDAFFGGPAELAARVTLSGKVGTLARDLGSTLDCTFTPEVSSTEVFAVPVFDKVLISDEQRASRASGRWGSATGAMESAADEPLAPAPPVPTEPDPAEPTPTPGPFPEPTPEPTPTPTPGPTPTPEPTPEPTPSPSPSPTPMPATSGYQIEDGSGVLLTETNERLILEDAQHG